MAVEVVATVEYDNTSNQEVVVTVHEDNDSQSFIARDGTNTYYLNDLDGQKKSDYNLEIDVDSDLAETTPTVKRIDVNIPGAIEPVESNRITAEADWHDYAIADEESDIVLDRYTVELVSVRGDARRIRPTNISYTPKVNQSKDLSVSTEPFEWLEGTDFLGAEIRVFAGGDEIYEGEVKEIDTNRNNDEYKLITKSHGKRLLGKAIDFGTRNQIATDAIAELVDHASEVPSELRTKANTSDERLNRASRRGDIGVEKDLTAPGGNMGRLRLGEGQLGENEGPGVAEYDAVGPSAFKTILYVKAYTPSAITVEATDGSTTYTEDLTGFSDNVFGKWYEVELDELADAWFDLTFTIRGDAILHNWRAVESPEIRREVEPPDTSDAVFDASLYTLEDFDGQHGMERVDTEHQTSPTHYGYRARQKTAWHTVRQGEAGAKSADGNVVEGVVFISGDYTWRELNKLDLADDFPEWEIRARIGMYNDLDHGTGYYRVKINGDVQKYSTDTTNLSSNRYEWRTIARYDDTTDWGNTLTSRDEIEFSGDPDNAGDGVGFGEFVVVVDTANSDLSFNYEYSDELTNGELTAPRKFASGYVEFADQPIKGDLTEATTTTTLDNTQDTYSVWGPIHTNEPDTWDTSTIPNDNTISTTFDGGSTHTTRVYLTAAGVRDTCTPREGYKSVQLKQVDVTGSYNDLQRIFDKELKGNILDVMNKITQDTSVIFRFEGDTVKVFEKGQLKTTEDLQPIEATSTASIEQVYRSVEVIGLNGVTSGIIEAADAPEFVTEHKEIRNQDISNKRDCVRKAESFLEENGEIKYKGEMKTLPTFAPLGELVDGSYFNHGKDMEIREVSYGRRRATIKLGIHDNIARELINISRSSSNTETRVTK